MENLFEGNLKLFKSSSLDEIDWMSEKDDLKLMVLAILMDSQHDLLFIDSELSQLSNEQLLRMIDVSIITKEQSHNGTTYQINKLIFRFPNDFHKSQSFVFISSSSASTRTKTTNFSTLLLVKSNYSKLSNLMFQWLSNKFGILTKSLKFKSLFIINLLNFIIDGLEPTDKSRLGDVELTYKPPFPITNNAINNIEIQILNKDVIEFTKIMKVENQESLLNVLNEYLEYQTSINFNKLNIIRLRCNFILITSDGRIRFLKTLPQLMATDVIKFTIWDLFHLIYGLI